jgi:hypothetical protein
MTTIMDSINNNPIMARSGVKITLHKKYMQDIRAKPIPGARKSFHR